MNKDYILKLIDEYKAEKHKCLQYIKEESYGNHIEYAQDRINECNGAIEVLKTNITR